MRNRIRKNPILHSSMIKKNDDKKKQEKVEKDRLKSELNKKKCHVFLRR